LEDREGITQALFNLGYVVMKQGDYTAARSLLEESLAIGRETENKKNIAWSLINLGRLALEMGDYAQARSLFEESLTINRELAAKRDIAECQEGLSYVACALGQLDRAARLLAAAAALREAIGSSVAPFLREDHDRALAAVRAGLSEAAFATAREAGRAMTWREAVAYALEEGKD
jgi:non-specific serine/threonine protein kinase